MAESVTLQARSRVAPQDDSACLPVEVSAEEHAEFEFCPQHYGEGVVFLNARNGDYYTRPLPRPKATVWVLTRKDPLATGYVLRRLVESGRRKNVQVSVINVQKLNLMISKDSVAGVRYDGKRVDVPDAVIPRVGASGADYFALAVVRQLERLGVVMLNNFESILVSRDKLHTIQAVAEHGLPVPTTVLAKFPVDVGFIEETFEFPVILKKSSGSQGKGVMKIESAGQLEDVCDMLDTTTPMIFQEYIEASAGRDLRVFVVGGKVVCTMMRVASKGFKANVHQGGSVRSAAVTGAVEYLCLETVRVLGLDIAGVDLLIDKNSYKICEVNSSPGFDGLEKATGVNVADHIIDYVRFRLGIWRKKKGGKADVELDVPLLAAHQE